MVTRLLIIVFVVATGCEKRSTKYCSLPEHQHDLANCEQTDAPPPDIVACTSDAMCPGGRCELTANVCVECLTDLDCEDGERCDVGGRFECRGCVDDSDCSGQTCLPTGTCGSDSKIVYVTADGTDNPDCTLAAPCATLTHGLTLITFERRYLRVTGDHTENVDVEVAVEIIGTGATLTAVGTAMGIVLKIGKVDATVYDLAIRCTGDQDGIEAGGSTATLVGIEVSGCDHEAGIDVKNGHTKIDRSNIHDNPAGGIRSDGMARVVITNNWIHHNGVIAGMIGGIKLGNDITDGIQVEFNTIVDNEVGGINCKTAIDIPNNIIASNGTLLANNVTVCTATDSLVTDDLTPLAFANASNAAMPYDYHIGATSSAKDNAPAASAIQSDYDGDIRPQGMAKDYGADEFRVTVP